MNQQKINYQKELDKIISALEQKGEKKTLLLHSCCAPCSSYVLEYLSRYFYITVFYYNPNIYPPKEYDTRMEEQKRLVSQMPVLLPVRVVEADYEPELFFEMIRGMERIPEGGERCFLCYEMRMRKAAAYAADQGFDYFTTTLSISPLKNAQRKPVCLIWYRILRRRTAISGLLSCRRNMGCTGKITADVCIPRGRNREHVI